MTPDEVKHALVELESILTIDRHQKKTAPSPTKILPFFPLHHVGALCVLRSDHHLEYVNWRVYDESLILVPEERLGRRMGDVLPSLIVEGTKRAIHKSRYQGGSAVFHYATLDGGKAEVRVMGLSWDETLLAARKLG